MKGFRNQMTIRLSDFIRENLELILQAWEDYASNISSSEDFDREELRDHASQMLMAIAEDLDTSQTDAQQDAKAKGRAPEDGHDSAETHGHDRQTSGFSMIDTLSEFRALRASVLSLWSQVIQTASSEHFEEVIRFGEAVDQAIAESIKAYSHMRDQDNRLFGAVLSASPDPIFVLDMEANVRYVNRATVDLLNMTRAEIIGRSIDDLGFSLPSNFQRNLSKMIADGLPFRGRFLHSINSGRPYQFDYQLAPVVDEEGNTEAIVCVSRDITQEAIAEEKIRYNANHDDLTGLPNRRLFMDRLEQEARHAKRSSMPFAVLFMDLDGFKDINDTFGHETGDRLLCEIAERLNSCVREEDTLARLGGDEFALILTGVGEHRYAERVAKSITDAFAMPFEVDQRSLHISSSIGIAYFFEDGTDSEALLKAADVAMYMAKKGGPSISPAL